MQVGERKNHDKQVILALEYTNLIHGCASFSGDIVSMYKDDIRLYHESLPTIRGVFTVF